MREQKDKIVLANVCGTCKHYEYSSTYAHTRCEKMVGAVYVHQFEVACDSYENNYKRKGAMAGRVTQKRGRGLQK